MEDDGLTKQLTSGEKKFRDKFGLLIQPIRWLILRPMCRSIAWIAGIVYGQETQKFLHKEILTPANLLTGARIGLLVTAIVMFFNGASLARQIELLFVAIITDLFDGPLARNNNEVTRLGTYMDHAGDWGIIIWVMFLNLWYESSLLPGVLYLESLAIIPTLFLIYIARFKKCYDSSVSFIANVAGFAEEDLQTDGWGRIQFFSLCIVIFGTLFEAALVDPGFILAGLVNLIPQNWRMTIIAGSLGIFLILGGFSIGDALNYSEVQVKKFKEKIRKIKTG